MNAISDYIKRVLRQDPDLKIMRAENIEKLPLYIGSTFHLYWANLFNQNFIVAALKSEVKPTIEQVEKWSRVIETMFDKKVVLAYVQLTALERQRLMQRGINFISLGKQLFLPSFLLDLRESFPIRNIPKEKLLPSAQFLLLYYLLHRNQKNFWDKRNFKELAEKFQYTQMGITKATENLRLAELCKIIGTKDKYLQFDKEISALWHDASPFLVDPVLKRIYVDKIPAGLFLLCSNESALPEYTDMNPSRQQFRAIEKKRFYQLLEENQFANLNDEEGEYCLEVWKYDPLLLVEELYNDDSVVDPLSLYLTLKDNPDERIEMAMEQIIDKYIW